MQPMTYNYHLCSLRFSVCEGAQQKLFLENLCHISAPERKFTKQNALYVCVCVCVMGMAAFVVQQKLLYYLSAVNDMSIHKKLFFAYSAAAGN